MVSPPGTLSTLAAMTFYTKVLAQEFPILEHGKTW